MPSHDDSTRICGYDADSIQVRGHDLVEDLMGKVSFSEMFLIQALGIRPSPVQVRILDAVMVTIMEHGLVPSAIATRLTHYGAPESFQGAVAAGLLGVGDRYAGTAGECGALLEKLVAVPLSDRRAAALAEIKRYRAAKRPLPGFGHPVHVKADPRVPRLVDIARESGAAGEYVETAFLVEICLEKELERKLPMNISAAIAAVLGDAGVPAAMMRGVVLTARCAGLVGHLLEEMGNPVADTMWDAVEKRISYKPDGE